MRCEECLPFVEDYFDGELDEDKTDLVGRHLSACESCADAYRKLEREQELYLNYEPDARPAPDFWDAVMARVSQEAVVGPSPTPFNLRSRLWSFRTPRFSPSLTALIVLIAIGITAGLMRYFNSRERAQDAVAISQVSRMPATAVPSQTTSDTIKPSKPVISEAVEKGEKTDLNGQPQLAKNIVGRSGKEMSAANRSNAERNNLKPAKSVSPLTPDELVRQAEQKYVAAITILSRDASRHRSRLDAEMAARFERTLAAIDRTIADTRRAAREHPGDPVAAQYMLTAYSKKVDVLREMIGY